MMRLAAFALLIPFAFAGPLLGQHMHQPAAPAMAGGVKVADAWARASAGQAAAGAAFLTVVNGGHDGDRLVGAATEVARKAELHTHVMEGDVMRMRPVDAIDIPAGKTVVLRPGGLHVMLMGLKQPLKEGTRFPLTLTFAKAGPVTVEVAVGPVGASHGQGMDMGHGAMGKGMDMGHGMK